MNDTFLNKPSSLLPMKQIYGSDKKFLHAIDGMKIPGFIFRNERDIYSLYRIEVLLDAGYLSGSLDENISVSTLGRVKLGIPLRTQQPTLPHETQPILSLAEEVASLIYHFY